MTQFTRQYQAPKIPAHWSADERRYAQAVNDVLDEIYLRYGRLTVKDLSPAVADYFQMRAQERIDLAIGEIASEFTTMKGQRVTIEMSAGSILDEDTLSTTASIKVYENGVEITDTLSAAAVRWVRISDDPAADGVWNADPSRIGTKSITLTGDDIDFKGMLRCVVDEKNLLVEFHYIDGELFVSDKGSGDAANFSLDEDGVLWYNGTNKYVEKDGELFFDMLFGAFQIDTQLSNLQTAYMSLSRRGISLFSTSGFNARGGAGSKYIGISNDHPLEYLLWAGAENPANSPLWMKRDGSINASMIQLGNSNITDFTAPIQDSDRDNADASNPFVFDIFIPGSYQGIQYLNLTFKRQPFRAYSTAAASGGGSAVTSRDGGGTAVTSRSGGGSTSGVSGITVTDMTSPTTNTQTVVGSNHYHTSGGHQHGMSHTHTINSHTHILDMPDHAHVLDIPNHTHGITYGIYQGPTATSCTVYVDGNYVGAFNALTSYNVASWLTKSAGKITRDTFHTISIYPNNLCRIVATVFGLALLGRAENAVL